MLMHGQREKRVCLLILTGNPAVFEFEDRWLCVPTSRSVCRFSVVVTRGPHHATLTTLRRYVHMSPCRDKIRHSTSETASTTGAPLRGDPHRPDPATARGLRCMPPVQPRIDTPSAFVIMHLTPQMGSKPCRVIRRRGSCGYPRARIHAARSDRGATVCTARPLHPAVAGSRPTARVQALTKVHYRRVKLLTCAI
jgi:hypothetical protein